MMQCRSILIPLDGSAFSRQIIPTILELFPADNCRLTLLHVADEPTEALRPTPAIWSSTWTHGHHHVPYEYGQNPYPASIDQIEASLRAAAEDELAQVAEHLRAAGYQVRTAVRFGDAAREIIDYARSQQVDTVAMATHGRSGLLQLMLGSVAEKVMHSLPMPVLLLRPNEHSRLN
jgi:nucleotide-binding universal stress UspA family protein